MFSYWSPYVWTHFSLEHEEQVAHIPAASCGQICQFYTDTVYRIPVTFSVSWLLALTPVIPGSPTSHPTNRLYSGHHDKNHGCYKSIISNTWYKTFLIAKNVQLSPRSLRSVVYLASALLIPRVFRYPSFFFNLKNASLSTF